MPQDEIDELRVTSDKTIYIQAFVAAREVDHAYFEKPYYLTPDGAEANDSYAVIREAMKQTATAAIGRVVLARADRAVTLLPRGLGMVMTTLRPPIDLRAEQEAFASIGEGPLDPEMVESLASS